MLNFKKTSPTARMVKDYIENGEFVFDNPVQRGFVWRRDKKSLLICSIIEGFPVPPIYANLVDGIYDIFDGKQRCLSIYEYITDKFALSNVPSMIENDRFDLRALVGKKFSQLEREVQNAILSYPLDLHFAENLTQTDIRDLFVRLNNGKPLTATEMTKAQTMSVHEVSELAKHPVFAKLMNTDAIEASKNIGYVTQALIILDNSVEDKTLLNQRLRNILKQRKVSNEDLQKCKAAFDVMTQVFESLEKNKRENKPVLLILKRKTHFTSMLQVALKVAENNIDINLFVEWVKDFFDAPVGETTISAEYNQALLAGTNKDYSVKERLSIVNDLFDRFLLRGVR